MSPSRVRVGAPPPFQKRPSQPHPSPPQAEAAVLNAEASVDKGENARMVSFLGAIAVADLVKTTLGPKGMDKILQSVSVRGGGLCGCGCTVFMAASEAPHHTPPPPPSAPPRRPPTATSW